MLRINLLTIRLCPLCEEVKSGSEFYIRPHQRDKVALSCHQCRSDYAFVNFGRSRVGYDYGDRGQSIDLADYRTYRRTFGGRCAKCGVTSEQGARIVPDHIVSISLGGRHELANLQYLCSSCNSSKGARFSTDYRENPDGVEVPLPPLEDFPCICGRNSAEWRQSECPRHKIERVRQRLGFLPKMDAPKKRRKNSKTVFREMGLTW